MSARALTTLLFLGIFSGLVAVQGYAQEAPEPVGKVSLQRDQAMVEANRLDIAVVVFDDGVPEAVAEQNARGILPKVRAVESTFLPVNLRQALQASDAWGVIRVTPEESLLAHVQVKVRIEQATGLELRLAVTVTDATGRVWLDRTYLDYSAETDYPVPEEVDSILDGDPFADIYGAIANDMLAARQALGARGPRQIQQVAFLRYAAALAPDAFGDYIAEQEGHYKIQRLPAEGDDMVARVERIRSQEYLFVDHVDEQYVDLQREMAPAYNLWRQYDREQALYRLEYEQRAAKRDKQGRYGSFSALQQVYNQYKVSKIQQQDIRQLARGFDNETAPTVLESSGQVYRLTGTLEQQYSDWRRILGQIFALETGLPSPAE
ncbi:hypothetical protein A3709_12610 [Halioglobus sp. HI00S01]|uniref:hypothetical protein n=1 Tax=Halioglobus sp. HI00S01 TaxID=1822214 RepID=UPI0007C2EB28|nr:hypothetical protein [Halioglobus sp. HI00S01]KZX60138.1 hypothetical protein A3709_12610 [Halioglobus sp. HI00S01]